MRFNERSITLSHLPVIDDLEPISMPETKISKKFKASSLQDKMYLYEKRYIEKVLKLNNGNKVKTAEMLEISIRNLYYKLNKHKIKE